MSQRKTKQYAYPQTRRVDVYENKLLCGECNDHDEDGRYIPRYMEWVATWPSPPPDLAEAGRYKHKCVNGHIYFAYKKYPSVEYRTING